MALFKSRKQRLFGGLGFLLSVITMEVAAMIIDVLYDIPDPWIAGIASIKTMINAGVTFAILAYGLYLGTLDQQDQDIIKTQIEETLKSMKVVNVQTKNEDDLIEVKKKIAEKQGTAAPIATKQDAIDRINKAKADAKEAKAWLAAQEVGEVSDK